MAALNSTRSTLNLLAKDLKSVLILILREDDSAQTVMADINTRIGTFNTALQAINHATTLYSDVLE